MARKRRRVTRKHHKHKPSAKAKRAYNKLIIKSYHRLKRVVAKHAPSEL